MITQGQTSISTVRFNKIARVVITGVLTIAMGLIGFTGASANGGPSASYSATTLAEAGANDGSVSATLTITLTGETFAGNDGDDLSARVTNEPAGLTAVLTRTSSTVATLSFTGNATSHANANDVANLTITFIDGDFTGGSAAAVTGANRSDLAINFADPAISASYSATTLAEAGANDGSVSATLTITLTGETFAGNDGDDLSARVTNEPAGLTAVLTRTSSTVATLSFTGNATSHANANDVANLTITFIDGDFTGGSAAAVTGANRSDLAINFADPAISASYSATTLAEAGANDGSVSATLTITLTGETFAGNDGDDLSARVTNEPAGLTAVLTRTSSTVATLSFTGNATSHANANDVANLTITFIDGDFTGGSAAAVTGANRSDLAINFADPAISASYSATTLAEAGANDGSVSATLTITLTGETFAGNDGDDLSARVTNEPAGLTAVLTRTSSTVATLSFTGNATSHANANDVANLTITFIDGDFTGGSAAAVTGANRSDLAINFADPAISASYSATTLAEAGANDGSVSATLTITLTGETFAGNDGDDLSARVTNEPAGLTAVLTRTSSTVATLSFTGNATSHANANDVANLTITFIDGDFTGGSAAAVTGANRSDLAINFADPAISASYSATTLAEAGANDGSVSATLTITLTGETFAGNDGDDLSARVTNEPAGLTAVLTRTSSTVATLSFTGNATSHANANDVANLTITFIDGDFTGGSAAAVTGANRSDLAINFADPAISASYSATTLAEAGANDGSVSATLTITLTGETFAGNDGDDLSARVTNEPAGLTAVLTRTSSTVATLSFTGNATSHANANDVANLTITFIDGDFTGGSAAAVTGANRSDLAINFADPAISASYSATTLAEAGANDGSVSATLTITLTGETFAGNDGDDLSARVTNEPAGLTAVLTRTSSTVATLSFTGNATSHANANDVANLTITFIDGDFTGGSAAAVTGANRSDLAINFADPASSSSSSSSSSGSTSSTTTGLSATEAAAIRAANEAAAKAEAEKQAKAKAEADAKAAADAAAKAAADKAALEKAAAEKAASDKLEAERNAAAEAIVKAEEERIAAAEAKAAATNVKVATGRSGLRLTLDLPDKYVGKIVTVYVGTKVKGKTVFKKLDFFALDKEDGTATISSKVKLSKGQIIRVNVGKTVVKSVRVA